MTPPRALFKLGAVTAKGRATITRGLKAGAPDALAPLVAIAVQFQTVGSWTVKEWAALTPEERRACNLAREEVAARDARRLAALIGLTVRHAGQAEEYAAEFDGGALLEQSAVDAALDHGERVAQDVPRGGP